MFKSYHAWNSLILAAAGVLPACAFTGHFSGKGRCNWPLADRGEFHRAAQIRPVRHEPNNGGRG